MNEDRAFRWRIGTSGWNYRHWRGIFYPEDVPQSKWLEYYAEHFDTVELNATFYRLPAPSTFKRWYDRTPKGFLWSIKASKFITHTRRLKDCQEPLGRLYGAVEPLQEKLGVILFQLPPSLQFDPSLAEGFFSLLKRGFRYALEVRHKSWIQEEALQLIRSHNIAFCISDTAGRYPYHEAITAEFLYIRLHGSKKLYASCYTEEEIAQWAKKLRRWNTPGFIYFDNDFQGHAPKNALQLLEALR